MSQPKQPEIKFFLPYGERPPRDDLVFPADEPSLTQQQFAEECDVNVILKKYANTGLVETNPLPAQYLDNSNAIDYHNALNIIIQAEDSFNSLSAELRERFHNDPAELLAFIDDKNNRQEAIDLGLVDSPQTAPAPHSAGGAGLGGIPTQTDVEASLRREIAALRGETPPPFRGGSTVTHLM